MFLFLFFKSTIIRMGLWIRNEPSFHFVCVCVLAIPIYVFCVCVFWFNALSNHREILSNVFPLTFMYPHWGFWNKFWTWGMPLCGWCIFTRHVILPFGKGPWRKLESFSPCSLLCRGLGRTEMRSMLSFLLSSCIAPTTTWNLVRNWRTGCIDSVCVEVSSAARVLTIQRVRRRLRS